MKHPTESRLGLFDSKIEFLHENNKIRESTNDLSHTNSIEKPNLPAELSTEATYRSVSYNSDNNAVSFNRDLNQKRMSPNLNGIETNKVVSSSEQTKTDSASKQATTDTTLTVTPLNTYTTTIKALPLTILKEPAMMPVVAKANRVTCPIVSRASTATSPTVITQRSHLFLLVSAAIAISCSTGFCAPLESQPKESDSIGFRLDQSGEGQIKQREHQNHQQESSRHQHQLATQVRQENLANRHIEQPLGVQFEPALSLPTQVSQIGESHQTPRPSSPSSIRHLIKRSGISDQRLAEIQMIRALKKQLERASKISSNNLSSGGQEPLASR